LSKDKTISKLTGCLITSLVFAVFVAIGLFALAGGFYLLLQGIKDLGEFWNIFETVVGVTIIVLAPVALIRVYAKYKQLRLNKEVDKSTG